MNKSHQTGTGQLLSDLSAKKLFSDKGNKPSQDAVVFHPLTRIYTSQSKWLVSFIYRLDSYESFLTNIGKDIEKLESLIVVARNNYKTKALHVSEREMADSPQNMRSNDQVYTTKVLTDYEAWIKSQQDIIKANADPHPYTRPIPHLIQTPEPSLHDNFKQDFESPVGPTAPTRRVNHRGHTHEVSDYFKNANGQRAETGGRKKRSSDMNTFYEQDYIELMDLLMNDCKHLKQVYDGIVQLYANMIGTLIRNPPADVTEAQIGQIVNRAKRFLASPLIGLASNVITGIINRKSYKKISKRVKALEDSDKKQLHVISESLSLLDLTYNAAAVNRLKLNELSETQQYIHSAVAKCF